MHHLLLFLYSAFRSKEHAQVIKFVKTELSSSREITQSLVQKLMKHVSLNHN
uniref:Uncharacterized protein n=1 Tax=Rhizophora mucronata TaxID=61149 RepID=A0A2P2QE96_RHIMU